MALTEPIRLQKYLASCGVASRRKAETLIQEGRVSVDGKVVTEMGLKVTPGLQEIRCNGKVVRPDQEKPVYILLNKPQGVVTTLSDPQGRPVVTSLLKNIKERVFPVGRLDFNTEGALLLTNDGDLAHKILHPKFETTKTYEALVKGVPTKDFIRKLEKGIMLDGRKTWPATLVLVKRSERNSVWRITIHEGRKHQVRKMFGAIDHPVLHLKRTAYGHLSLGSLKSGAYRFLKPNELKKIFF